MTLDHVKKQISCNFSLGFDNSPVSVQSNFGDQIDDAKRLFFDISFRRASFFGDFADRRFYPFSSFRMRLLDFIVFQGDKIRMTSTGPADTPQKAFHAVTFDKELIFLANESVPGPYVRFSTDSSISSYKVRIGIYKLIFDLNVMRVLQAATIDGCLHQIDSDYCLICTVGRMPVKNYTECGLCSSSAIGQNSVPLCLDFGMSPTVSDPSNIEQQNTTLMTPNPYLLNPKPDTDVSHYSLGSNQVKSRIEMIVSLTVR